MEATMRRFATRFSGLLYLVAAGCAVACTGCQVDVGGQTLPSAYYQTDDVQYFPPGPEFKLSREAAAQKAYAEDKALEEGPAP